MNLTLELPDDLAQSLTREGEDPLRAVLEAIAIQGIRTRRFSTGQVRRLLGFSTRYEVDGWLKERGVPLELSEEELQEELAAGRAAIVPRA